MNPQGAIFMYAPQEACGVVFDVQAMAKGSVRKKSKKWYDRFYIEDESGRKVQKEFAGTGSKAETEAMLRKAIADYEEKQFVGKAENITVGATVGQTRTGQPQSP